MGKHTKLGSSRLDHYYFLAKSMGFRARSAFKILQLNKKYDFLSSAHAYVELCAAPGGALQAAQQAMPVGSIIIGVDLVKIKPIPGVQTLQADITSQYCFNQLKKMLNNVPLDVVFCDGAPNVSGEFKLDCYNQNVLVLYALKSACTLLRQGGTFISKIFRGEYLMNIVYILNQLFESVELNKPDSSRTQSAEIFVVCRQFKGALATIDEKMFDPQVVLQNKSQQETLTLKALSKQLDHNVRHRTGYNDSLVNKVTDIVTFITSQKPIEILAKVNSILFDVDIENDYRFKSLKEQFEQNIGIEFNNRVIKNIQEWKDAQDYIKSLTDKEMIEQLKDIKQLSKTALQNVINYHRKMFGALCRKIVTEIEVQIQEFDENKDKVKTTDELIAEQEQQLLHQQKLIARKQEKEKEKKLKKFAQYDKENVENQVLQDNEVVQYNFDSLQDPELLRRFLACEEVSESEESIDTDQNQKQLLQHGDKYVAINDNDEYLDNMDEELNLMYEDYEKLREKEKEEEKEKIHLENLKEGIDDTEDQWFKQKEFDQFADSFKLPRENLMKHKQKQERKKKLLQQQKEQEKQQQDDQPLIRDIAIIENNQNDYEISSSEDDQQVGEDIEEVEEINQEEQVEEEQEYPQGEMPLQKLLNKKNIDNTAMKLALATKMLHRKGKRELEESAYNRKMFECNEPNLPDWFIKDEKEHCQVSRPVSAAEIQQAKLKLKELQEMPRTKKEREALARKKLHSQQKLNAMQGKIQEVVQSDLTEKEKVRKLRQLQKAAQPKQKTKKIVQGNTGRVVSKGKNQYGIQFVDKRDKHERRVLKQREKRLGKKFNIKKIRR